MNGCVCNIDCEAVNSNFTAIKEISSEVIMELNLWDQHLEVFKNFILLLFVQSQLPIH